MKLGEGVEWAVHSCSVLAFLAPDEALSAGKLAEFHGVPAPYLTKHLQALVRAGVCRSTPGPRGGFRLGRPPAEITLLDIVLAVDGEEPAFRCQEIRQRGPSGRDDPACYTAPCGIASAMWRAEDAWRQELRSTTVADLTATLAATVHPQQLQESAVWLADALGTRRNRS